MVEALSKQNHKIALLEELRNTLGGRLSERTVFDGNICTTRTTPEEPWHLISVSGQPFTHELRTRHGKKRVIVWANQLDCKIEVQGKLATRILTINQEERIGGFRSEYCTSRKIGSRQYPIFTEEGKLSATQEQVLTRPELAALLDQVMLSEDESVHFNNGGIDIYLKRPSAFRCLNALERVGDLIDQIQTAPHPSTIIRRLPPQFQPLEHLINKWAVSDDAEREALLEDSSDTELRQLVGEVEPYFQAVNSYLDSFPDGVPNDEAAELGWLVECALEAKQKIAKAD